MKKILVACALIERNGFFLATRRSLHKELSGYWEFPGGKVELGESLNDCIEREIFEELNCKVKAKGYCSLSESFENNKLIQLHSIFCELVESEPYPCHTDHDLICWITPTNMRRLKFAPADTPFINLLLSKSCDHKSYV